MGSESIIKYEDTTTNESNYTFEGNIMGLKLINTYEDTTAEHLRVVSEIRHQANVEHILLHDGDFSELPLKIKILRIEEQRQPSAQLKEKIQWLELLLAQPFFEFHFDPQYAQEQHSNMKAAIKDTKATINSDCVSEQWSVDETSCKFKFQQPDHAKTFFEQYQRHFSQNKMQSVDLDFSAPTAFKMLAEYNHQGPAQFQQYMAVLKSQQYRPERPTSNKVKFVCTGTQ